MRLQRFIRFVLFVLALSLGLSTLAKEVDETHTSRAILVGTSAVATTLARADLALAKSLINPKHFSGDLGESVAEKVFVKEVLSKSRSGVWRSIVPRSGRQGLDHLFIKTDKNGMPRDLIVGESKYNKSMLGMTRDGIQTSKPYTAKRLSGLASRYRHVALEDSFEFRSDPLNPNRRISVVLKDGKEVSFWKTSSTDEKWKFTGSRSQLAEAKKLASAYADFIGGAAEGKTAYRSRIFHVTPHGANLRVDIHDARGVERVGKIEELKMTGSFEVKDAMLKSQSAKIEIARTLQSKLGMTDAEAKKLATRVCQSYSSQKLMTESNFSTGVLVKSGAATGVAVALDTITQFALSGEIDFKQLGLSAGSVFVGTTTGQFVHAATLSLPPLRNSVNVLARVTRIPAAAISTGMAGFSGGLAATAVLSYGAYFLGAMDLESANRSMISGTVGAGAGALASAGIMGLVSACGTAGTGVAISSLSGAAATNASLAFLGGGTLAAGGGGVALGTVVLGGAALAASVVAALVVDQCFEMKKDSDECERIKALAENYRQPEQLEILLKNNAYGRALGF